MLLPFEAVKSRPFTPFRVVHVTVVLFISGHAPIITPIGRGRIVAWLQSGQVIGEAVVTYVRIVAILGERVEAAHTILVVGPAEVVLGLGLAPSEIVAVFFREVGTQVAGGPQSAAWQTKVDIGVVKVKVRHQGPCSIHGEGIGRICGDHLTVFGPIGEDVTFVGYGCKIANGILLIITRSSDSATLSGIWGGLNGPNRDSGEAQLVAISQAIIRNRVGSYIVSSVRGQPIQRATEAAYARPLVGVIAINVGGWCSVPAHAAQENVATLGQNHHSACYCTRGGDVGKFSSGH